jgi:hypothetical protein
MRFLRLVSFVSRGSSASKRHLSIDLAGFLGIRDAAAVFLGPVYIGSDTENRLRPMGVDVWLFLSSRFSRIPYLSNLNQININRKNGCR